MSFMSGLNVAEPWRFYITETSNNVVILPPKPTILGRAKPFDWTQFYKMLPHASIGMSKVRVTCEKFQTFKSHEVTIPRKTNISRENQWVGVGVFLIEIIPDFVAGEWLEILELTSRFHGLGHATKL